MKTKVPLFTLACAIFIYSGVAIAGDESDLMAMLDEFLAHAGESSAHEKFWAEDLVYTSSRGTRTNKPEIMASFEDPEGAAERAAGPAYTGEDVDIRLYGDMAVIAFKLVGTPDADAEDATVQYYFNTGTFLKRDGVWKVVAWHATKIPPPE